MASLISFGYRNILLLLCLSAIARGGIQHGISDDEKEPLYPFREQELGISTFDDDNDPQMHFMAKRSTGKLVDIARFEDSSPPGKQFSVYVDDTITRLIIQVKVERSNPLMMLTKASGVPGPHETRNASTGTVYHISTVDTPITAADYGIWKIMKMDGSKWHVLVQAESSVDFTYQFIEDMGLFKMPLTGDPIQGTKYILSVEVQDYAKIQKVDLMLIFVLVKSTPANMIPAVDKGSGKYEVDMDMIDQEFMIGIQGKDNSGHFCRRVSELIKPVTLKMYVPPYTGVKLYENTTLEIEFSVVNKLPTDQDLDIRIEDTKHWAQAPIFISPTLKPGENYTGKFVIKAGAPGETTVATIKARQYLGHGKFSPGPEEVRQFTVIRNHTTTTSTTTTPAPSTTTPSTTSTTAPTSTTASLTTKPSSSTSPASSGTTKKATTSGSASTSINNSASSTMSSATTKSASSSKTSPTGSNSPHSSTSTNPQSSSVPKSSTTGSSGSGGASTSSTNKPASGVTTIAAKSTSTTAGPSGGKKGTTIASSTSKPKAGVSTKSSTTPVAGANSAGKATTDASTQEDANDESGDSFSKSEVFAAAIGSGIGVGVLIGVAALVTMGLILKGSMKNQRAVTPEDPKKKTLDEFNSRKRLSLADHDQLAWT